VKIKVKQEPPVFRSGALRGASLSVYFIGGISSQGRAVTVRECNLHSGSEHPTTASATAELKVRLFTLIGKGPCPNKSGRAHAAGQNKRPRDAGPSCSDLVRVIVAWVVTS
jgi:hypothetical protein